MRSKGFAYENTALKYLKKQGLSLITQNYSCRSGEIDLIMQDGSTIVFVEVRFRSSGKFGTAAQTVTKTKQQKIIRTASHYLTQNNLWNRMTRFDVVSISQAQKTEEIQWIPSAFLT